jgi:hypothetical protein
LLFYALLCQETRIIAGQFQAGIMQIRKSDIVSLVKYEKDNLLNSQILELFRANLDELFQEIFSLDIPFSQTKDPQQCQNCNYRTICGI